MNKKDSSRDLSKGEDAVLFIDRTCYGADNRLIHQTHEAGYLTRIAQPSQPCINMITDGILCACFLFDYPNIPDLVELCETKHIWPRLPILVVTIHHSEEFAIWAFRNKVYDFFSQPVDTGRFFFVLAALRNLRQTAQQQRPVNHAWSGPLPVGARVSSTHAIERRLHTAIAYLERHYPDKIMQKSVAEACGMSTFQFSRAFHEEFGVSFQEYLLRLRVEKAAVLLRNPPTSVIEAALATGFNDPSYFSRAFKKLVGMLPSEYKLKHQQIAHDNTEFLDTIPQIREKA